MVNSQGVIAGQNASVVSQAGAMYFPSCTNEKCTYILRLDFPLIFFGTAPPTKFCQDYSAWRPEKKHTHTLIQHTYKTKYIQHEKYNIRWEFWGWVWRHCAVPHVKVQEGTTKIRRTSSLIRNMYLVRYIVKIHTTWLYNTPIQHENWDIKRGKTRFYLGGKRRHIYMDRFRIKFILTNKTNKAIGRGT